MVGFHCGGKDAFRLRTCVAVNGGLSQNQRGYRQIHRRAGLLQNSYVAALFAACGSVAFSPFEDSRPKRRATDSAIIWSFRLPPAVPQMTSCVFLEEKDFRFKIAERKNVWAVYIKDSASICDMLAYMGADKAVLTLNNLLIEREIRNNANRQKKLHYRQHRQIGRRERKAHCRDKQNPRPRGNVRQACAASERNSGGAGGKPVFHA